MSEKLRINIYKGLPIILDKVKAVALAEVIGKGSSWINNKRRHNIIKGKPQEFVESDLAIINEGLTKLGDAILTRLVTYSEDRDSVILRVKTLSEWISMPYVYGEVMKKTKGWYSMRMVRRTTEGKVSVFKEDDILAINMAAMQIANELKSIEFVL